MGLNEFSDPDDWIWFLWSEQQECPRCGKQGLLIERPTVTKRGNKKYTYRKLYVAHYLGNGISKNGKLVDRIKWCYLNAEHIKKLQSHGVTQNENRNLSLF